MDRETAAVLVPCGHDQFCLECGLQWADTRPNGPNGPGRPGREAATATCPLCRDTIEQVIPFTERPLMELDIDYRRYIVFESTVRSDRTGTFHREEMEEGYLLSPRWR